MSRSNFKSNWGYLVAGLVIFAVITSVFYEIKSYNKTTLNYKESFSCQSISTQ